MTATTQRDRDPSWLPRTGAHSADPASVSMWRPARSRRLPAGWPVWTAVAGYPVVWVLGLTPLLFPALAVALTVSLARRGRLRVPPGFGLWAMFLIVVVLSVVAMNQQAPDTLPPSGMGRYFFFALRLVNYLSVTLLMLYVGNLTERQLSQRSVMNAMAALFVAVVGLGLLAVAFPRLAIHSPIGRFLPAGLTSSDAGGDAGVLRLSQVQDVLGYSAPRPAAPFTYTNAWGNVLSLLLVWFAVVCLLGAGRRMRVAGVFTLVVALVPIIFSLNRGLWLGLLVSVAYVVLRLAFRGRLVLVTIAAVAMGVLGAVVVFSPLGATIQARIANGHSNDIRSSLASDSIAAVKESPILGYGSTRSTAGSPQSIAVGKTADCPRCGNRVIGSTGQLWLLLISQGLVGTALYYGFFLRALWVYRRDRSPIGMAGQLSILLSFFYSLFYTALLMPLCVTMLSIALLWRNDIERRQAKAAAEAAALPARSGPSPVAPA